MKLRKTVSLILALILALSLAVPSFAYDASNGEVEETTGSKSFDMNVTISQPNIRVIFSDVSKAGVILNPYGLTVDATAIGLGAEETAPILTKPQYVKNLGDSNLQVEIGIIATATNVTLASSKVDETKPQSKKSAFLYMETKLTTVADADKVLNGEDLGTSYWQTDYAKRLDAKNVSQLVITATTKGVTMEPGVLAAAADPTGSATAGDISTFEPEAGGVLLFKVAGNCATELTEGNWTSADKVALKVTFTFVPTGAAASYQA